MTMYVAPLQEMRYYEPSAELYTLDGKTIFPQIDTSQPDYMLIPRKDWKVSGYISIEIPEDAEAKKLLFDGGDTKQCKLIERTKEEYEAQ